MTFRTVSAMLAVVFVCIVFSVAGSGALEEWKDFTDHEDAGFMRDHHDDHHDHKHHDGHDAHHHQRHRGSLKHIAKDEIMLRYPTASKHERKDQLKLIRLFWLMADLMEFLSILNWIDYGTLIGQWRDQRLFLNDKDVDYSTLATNWKRFSESATTSWLKERSCFWVDNSHRHKGRKKGVVSCDWFSRTPRQGADVYGWAEEDSHILPPTREMCRKGKENMSLPCGVCPVRASWIFPLDCSQSLHLRSVCTPNQTVTHLTRLYGSLKRGAKCDKRRCCTDN